MEKKQCMGRCASTNCTQLPEDKRPGNDTLQTVLFSKAFSLGDVTEFKASGNEFELSCHNAQLKVIFYRDDIFRFWMSYDGEFTNPAANDIVINSFNNFFLLSVNILMKFISNKSTVIVFLDDNLIVFSDSMNDR